MSVPLAELATAYACIEELGAQLARAIHRITELENQSATQNIVRSPSPSLEEKVRLMASYHIQLPHFDAIRGYSVEQRSLMHFVLSKIGRAILSGPDMLFEWLQIAEAIGQTSCPVRQVYRRGGFVPCCDLMGVIPGVAPGWVQWEPFIADYLTCGLTGPTLNICYPFGHLMALLCALFGADAIDTMIRFGIDFQSKASNGLTPLALITMMSGLVSPHSVRLYRDKTIEGPTTLLSLNRVRLRLELYEDSLPKF